MHASCARARNFYGTEAGAVLSTILRIFLAERAITRTGRFYPAKFFIYICQISFK